MQARTHTWLSVMAPLALLAGCAYDRDYSREGAADASIAQVRSEMSALDERVSSVDTSVQAAQSQLAGIARENAALSASIRDQQDSVKQTMATLAATQRTELDRAARSITAASAQELDQMNKQLAGMPTKLQGEVLTLHKKTAADLATLQKDILALQAQINAYASRIERLEQLTKSGGASSTPSSSGAAASSGGTKSPSTASTMPARTGVPSSQDIDYTKVYTHTVAQGETLWKIAKDYEVSVQDIININTSLNDSGLRPGQQLYIPYRKKAGKAE